MAMVAFNKKKRADNAQRPAVGQAFQHSHSIKGYGAEHYGGWGSRFNIASRGD